MNNKDESKKRRAHEEEALSEFDLAHTLPMENPTREQIALDTLARYSGDEASHFQKYILLTNFPHYVDQFAQLLPTQVHMGSVLKVAHCPEDDVSIIDYRVGAPMAALIIDVISYTKPQCVIMLGLCGGLHRRHQIGDFLLPIAAIRDEGASRHYMPPQVPSLPAFLVQQFISEELMAQGIDYKTGVLHTTDYRMWEFDEAFKQRLSEEKASAIDMECSALFTAGFARKVPVGALMLISDLPLQPSGIKTRESSHKIFQQYTDLHLAVSLAAVKRMRKLAQQKQLNFRRFHF